MSAQAGKDMLLKIRDATGAFISVAGIRTRMLTFRGDAIDTTHHDAAGRWRTLLAGGATRSVSLSGTGIFKDAATDALIRASFFDAALPVCQLVIPDFGIITGPFQIVTLTYEGEQNAEVTFHIALQSAGQITYVAI
jgi:TP901-1 family phage major tail protein